MDENQKIKISTGDVIPPQSSADSGAKLRVTYQEVAAARPKPQLPQSFQQNTPGAATTAPRRSVWPIAIPTIVLAAGFVVAAHYAGFITIPGLPGINSADPVANNMGTSSPTATNPTSPTAGQALSDLVNANVGLMLGFQRYEITLPQGDTFIVDDLEGQIGPPGGTGTCFAVSQNGVLLTNKHVVENPLEGWSKTVIEDTIEKKIAEENGPQWKVVYKGQILIACFGADPSAHYECKVLHESKTRDLAILKIDRKFASPFALATTIKQGDDVRAVGYPGVATATLTNDEEIKSLETKKNKRLQIEKKYSYLDLVRAQEYILSITNGIVSAIRPSVPGYGDCLQTTASVAGGNSGGPLLDCNLNVVGIMTFVPGAISHEIGGNYNYALDIRSLKDEISPYMSHGDGSR